MTVSRLQPYAITAAQIVPDALELDDNPVVTLSFISYGISGAESYRDVVHSIACRHLGQSVGYVPHIFVTNEAAMIAGREWLGWPKVLADITFSTRTSTLDGVITARMERPAGLELAVAQFVPAQRLDDQTLTATGENITMNLRVIPSPVPGEPPTTTELVPSTMTALSGEVWVGHGSVHLTGVSEFAPLHRFPVIEALGAMMIRKAQLRLTAPTEIYPLQCRRPCVGSNSGDRATRLQPKDPMQTLFEMPAARKRDRSSDVVNVVLPQLGRMARHGCEVVVVVQHYQSVVCGGRGDDQIDRRRAAVLAGA